jgi:hypothetical protein
MHIQITVKITMKMKEETMHARTYTYSAYCTYLPGLKCIIRPTQSPNCVGKYGENAYGSPAMVADVQYISLSP